MADAKRILSIEIKRLDDDSPDTSWLGAYASRPNGDYSIDRKHSLDCPINNPQESEVSDQLQRVLSYLYKRSSEVGNDSENPYYWGFADAQDIIGEAQDTVNACTCEESGDWSHSEYQYFNTSGNYQGEPLADIVQYTKADYERMESLNAGNWGFIGIQAHAEIVIGNVCQKITSGGLWGIESDSDESYFREVESENLVELRGILHDMGFSKRAIAQSVKTANLSE
jgi:hypothetical protein